VSHPASAALTIARAAPAALTIEGVAKRFRGRDGRIVEALAPVDLTIPPGEFVTIVGPSGCGKSTLLNLLSGLAPPSSGRLRFGGTEITGVDRRIGYVTQQDNLFPWRSLRDNVAFPLELAGVSARERLARADAWLERVGLAGFGAAYPHELSGGMRQRGNIVRTLIYEPAVILMDEPFGPLDAQTRLTLQTLLLGIWESTRPTMLFVTHDLVEAIALADRVLLMSARPGRILRDDRVAIPRPREIAFMHDDPTFRALHDGIWRDLSREVVNAQPHA
jgi:NitT/TauT family transport system ATP-binding protein